MKSHDTAYDQAITALDRQLDATITCTVDSTDYTFTTAQIKSIKIDYSAPQGKTFGFSVSQEATIELMPTATQLPVGTEVIIAIGAKNNDLKVYTPFYIDTKRQDQRTGVTTYTCSDLLAKASKMSADVITFDQSRAISWLRAQIASAMGTTASIGSGLSNSTQSFTLELPNTTSLRDLLDDVLEISGAIGFMTYRYVSATDTYAPQLRFTKPMESSLTINKADYYDFTTTYAQSELTGIASINSLNDIISVGNTTGHTECLIDNIFLSKTDDTRREALLNNIYDNLEGTTFTEYSLDWRANPILEVSDGIDVIDKNGNHVTACYLGESITFNGGLRATSDWQLTPEEDLSLVSSNSIKDSMTTTRAFVDKANSRIELLVEKKDGEDVINSASIVAAINDAGSEVVIGADHIDLTGTVTFHNLETSGESTINAANITTGTLSANLIQGGTLAGSDININEGAFTVDNSGNMACQNIVSFTQIAVGDNDSSTNIYPSRIESGNVQANSIVANNSFRLSGISVYPSTSSESHTYSFHPELVRIDPPTGHPFVHLICASTIPVDTQVSFKLTFRSGISTKTFTLNWSFSAGSSTSATQEINFNIASPVYTLDTTAQQKTIIYGGESGFTTAASVLPRTDDNYDLGSSSHRWDDVYATNSTIQTSDRNNKKDIQDLSSRYSLLFDKLQPVSFKFNNGHRTHTGFIAQDVEQALADCNISSEDFACLIKSTDEDGNTVYGLRYTELIALLVNEVQILKNKVKELEHGNMD